MSENLTSEIPPSAIQQILAKIEELRLDMRAGFRRVEREMTQIEINRLADGGARVDVERRLDRLEDRLENNAQSKE